MRHITDPEPGIRELIIGATPGLTGLPSVFSPLVYPGLRGATRHIPIAAHPHPSFRTERADFSSAFAPANASAHGERNLSSSFPAPAPSAEIALMLWLVIKSANAYLFVEDADTLYAE